MARLKGKRLAMVNQKGVLRRTYESGAKDKQTL